MAHEIIPRTVRLGDGFEIAPLCFEIVDGRVVKDADGRYLDLLVAVWDRCRPGHRLEIRTSARLRAGTTMSEALPEALTQMWTHEVDECLLLNGKRLREPHEDK